MTIITNGKIILPDEVVTGYDLVIQGNEIVDILSEVDCANTYKAKKTVDANGGYIAPGFVDIHSDYIELVVAPRPSSLMDFSLAIREAERVLLSHGVTTMFHSLSMYKVTQAFNKPIREKDNVDKLISLIKDTHNKKHLIRHRFHARYEIDNTENTEDLIQYIREGKIDMLSFMDHTPGQGQFNDIEAYKKMARAYGSKLNDKEMDNEIKKRKEGPKLSAEDCIKIAKIAKEHNVSIASHDDDSVEKLHLIKEYDTTISEFPISIEIAKKAREMGFYTMAGTPNVLLGGSHSGNLAAHEAISQGLIDILCSDYYPASILHSVFKLHKEYKHDLAEIFRMVSLNPATAVNINNEIGSIEKGKRADIIIIETIENDFPVITSCFVDGSHVMQINYRD
jgi:phosphonate metabolism protein PhnM